MTAPRPLINMMKIKLWLRHRTVSAPQMTIKRQLSWPARGGILLGIVGLIGAFALGGYDLGRNPAKPTTPAGNVPAAPTAQQMAKVSAERDQYAATANAAESQITIARSAQSQLAAQVKALEAENNKLKEDLAFFESLLPADKAVGGVAIRRLKANIVGPNLVRYRLVVMQGGKAERDFTGSVQLAVTVMQAGKSAIIVFPETAARDQTESGKFQLAFKRYQRVDGLLTLPNGAEIKSMQARILEKGQLRAQQTTIPDGSS